jgi:hypothetical protein
MRFKLLLPLLAAVAVAVPTAAVAKGGPGHGGTGPGVQMQATYELHGVLSAFTPAVGTTPGSITILVQKANRAGRPLVGLTLTFPVGPTTKIEPRGAVIVDGDLGSVQVKGPPNLDAAGLQALAPKQIEDEPGDD